LKRSSISLFFWRAFRSLHFSHRVPEKHREFAFRTFHGISLPFASFLSPYSSHNFSRDCWKQVTNSVLTSLFRFIFLFRLLLVWRPVLDYVLRDSSAKPGGFTFFHWGFPFSMVYSFPVPPLVFFFSWSHKSDPSHLFFACASICFTSYSLTTEAPLFPPSHSLGLPRPQIPPSGDPVLVPPLQRPPAWMLLSFISKHYLGPLLLLFFRGPCCSSVVPTVSEL